MRSNGVLMHISSLPSNYGIGTLGQAAFDFADRLKEAEVQYWQVLPLGPTSYGDSPYQSFSSFAGNPYFIDLDILCQEGFLQEYRCKETFWGDREEFIDYSNLYYRRFDLLWEACHKFREEVILAQYEGLSEERVAFLKSEKLAYNKFSKKEAYWLDDFSLYCALKDANEGRAWYDWDDSLKFRKQAALDIATKEHEVQVTYYKILQYWFDKQWKAFRKYLKECEIKLIGDIPIYVAYDSVEVWVSPKLFSLDRKLNQVKVAGCPPDGFDPNGQLWGNPIYNWKAMEKDGYSWWLKRLGKVFEMHDTVRIDHFRGFASYYEIPAKDDTAKNGKWVKGPGIKFFNRIKEAMGDVDIIAEDLGFITDDVVKLLEDTGYPGMKIIQFAFGDWQGQNMYLPHNHNANCVVYTGTHDNDTSVGWYYTLDDWTKSCVNKYLNITESEGINWGIIRAALMSHADLAVIPMQDYLGFGSDCRMNKPSSIGENWKWRIKRDQITDDLFAKILDYNRCFGRASWRPEKKDKK